jgi:ribosomal protein L16 Arg81 hydroxylase
MMNKMGTFLCSEMICAVDFADVIHPMPKDRFFEDHFESKQLQIQRASPDYFSELLSMDEIDRFLTSNSFRTSEVFLVNAERPVGIDDFTSKNGLIDVSKVFRLHAEGATIILNRINAYHKQLSDLCAACEIVFGATCGANVYVTPPGAKGFGAHFDTHDVFILQLHGSKRWRFYGRPIILPIAGHGDQGNRDDPGTPTAELDVNAGDTLYIPRGLVHDARSFDETSVHVTLGVFAFTWSDLLLEALASSVLSDPIYRHSLPASFMLASSDRRSILDNFHNLIRHFCDNADLEIALESLTSQYVARRRTNFRGQMSQIDLAKGLTQDSKLTHRPHLAHTVREEGSQLRIRCYGNEVVFTDRDADVVRYVLRSPSFFVHQVPDDLDYASKKAVLVQLIYAGLLVVVTDQADETTRGSKSTLRTECVRQ